MVRSHRIAKVARVSLLLALLIVAVISGADAAPGGWAPLDAARHQSLAWLSAERAAALDVGFTVFVPSFIPAPFGGEPSISAYPGYYRLYWFIPGTPPTFLQITGEVGGFIPAYSEYDRNNQIFVNATVQGYEAYHDLTPIYDRVYWRAGDVVYTVDSRGLSSTDSLSLANSLTALAPPSVVDDPGDPPNDDGSDSSIVPGDGASPSLSVPANVPSGETAAIVVGGVSGAMLTADGGLFPASGADSLADLGPTTVVWQAPATASNLNVFFILLNPSNGNWLATGETVVSGAPAPASETGPEAPPVEAEAPAAQPDDNDDDPADSAPEPTSTPGLLSDGTGAGLIGVQVASIGDGTGGAARGVDDNPETASNIQEERPGDLTGIGSEATQETLPSESEDGAERTPGPTRTPAAPPTAEPTSTPGPSPTATIAPTTGLDGLVSRVIGPEGGELVNPVGATLTVPAGALTEDATVTIVPVADTKLPVVADVDFVPGSAFDVTVATATGQSVEQLLEPASLRIDVPREQWRDGMTLYRIEGMAATSIDGATHDDAGVWAETDHFSRFVAGLPIATESDRRDPLPFIIAALGILAVLLLIVGYVTAQRGRRPRAITPRSRRYR
ncbi:MAG: hypothetical protein ACRDJW_10365 [Thermomicrobiales bacterium]